MAKISYKSIIIIIGLLFILILFALIAAKPQSSIKEGYNLMSGMESPLSKSDFYAILTECVGNISNHEIILSTHDPKYKADKVSINRQDSDIVNIKNILRIMKKQDIEIAKLLPTYMLNTDLDGLLDDSLLKPIATDLKQKSTYAENPMECDPVAIQKSIDGYEALIEAIKTNDDPSKGRKMLYGSMASQLRMKLVDLKSMLAAPGNTKCLPALSPTDAEKILDGFYANYIAKIAKSQNMAILKIQDKVKSDIIKFYSAAAEDPNK